METTEFPKLLSPTEAAAILRKHTATLKLWRRDRQGPDWIKVAGRIYYRADDLTAYLDQARMAV